MKNWTFEGPYAYNGKFSGGGGQISKIREISSIVEYIMDVSACIQENQTSKMVEIEHP